MFAPWLFMFVFMPHLHERYVVYIAAFSTTWIKLGTAPIVLHVLITTMAFVPMLHMMVISNPQAAPELACFLDRILPETAWALLGIAMYVLYLSARGPGWIPSPRPDDQHQRMRSTA